MRLTDPESDARWGWHGWSHEVFGISPACTPAREGAVAIGFAIPAATVLDVASQLERSGRAWRGPSNPPR